MKTAGLLGLAGWLLLSANAFSQDTNRFATLSPNFEALCEDASTTQLPIVAPVAWVSKPAVSPISKSAWRGSSHGRRGWKPAIQQTWKSALLWLRLCRTVFLCLGQSNMEGFPGIEEQDKRPVDERFQMLAAVDFPRLNRTNGNWYPAVPPLSRPSAGLGPADDFGRTLVSSLPPHIKVGVLNVSIGGCKIELFDKENYQAYVATSPNWMTDVIATYSGNPYQDLVDMARVAQKDGVIKGILLHQGESNTNDREWPNKVKGVYENLRKDLNLKADEVPLIAGEVVLCPRPSPPRMSFHRRVARPNGIGCISARRATGSLVNVMPK